MRGRLWLKYFTDIINSRKINLKYKKYHGKKWTPSKWTDFMYDIMDGVGKKMKCHVVHRRTEKKEYSGEYMDIDAFFIDNAEYELIKKKSKEWDPFVLPRAVVELENNFDVKRISYALWKILCIRAPIRVLICYQRGSGKVATLKKQLEDVIWRGSLMKGTDGDLLVIIGDENKDEESSYGDYFTVFEWRNDRLEKIEGLER